MPFSFDSGRCSRRICVHVSNPTGPRMYVPKAIPQMFQIYFCLDSNADVPIQPVADLSPSLDQTRNRSCRFVWVTRARFPSLRRFCSHTVILVRGQVLLVVHLAVVPTIVVVRFVAVRAQWVVTTIGRGPSHPWNRMVFLVFTCSRFSSSTVSSATFAVVAASPPGATSDYHFCVGSILWSR